MATARAQLPAALTITCSVFFIPTASILLGLRFYTRRTQKARIGMDDWLMIPAFVFLMGMQITMIIEVAKTMIGYADPNFAPGVPDASTNLAFWPFELQQIPALGLVKLSIVFFYRRVFNTGGTPWYHWTTAITIAIITLWTVAYFFAFLFICGTTPSNYWKSAKDEKAFCVKTQKLHLSFAVSDMILDCIVMIIALPMIWNLHMSTSRKFAVTAVFGLGMVTVAASITRMAVFVQATALRFDADLDFEYLDTDAIYWSMLETGLGFITANCIIVFSLVAKSNLTSTFRSLRSRLFSRSSSHSGIDSQREVESSYQMRRKGFSTINSANVSAAGRSVDRDIEEMPLDERHIRVETQFGSSVQ